MVIQKNKQLWRDIFEKPEDKKANMEFLQKIQSDIGMEQGNKFIPIIVE